MRLVIISDTHTRTIPPLPEGDILIHCGDHTFEGASNETHNALTWLNSQPHKHKIFIAGNHECGWESPAARVFLLLPATNCIYLHDSSIEIEGIKFWGSPVQPEFYSWAFQLPRGEPLRKHWEKIPKDVDILITHGPPAGIGDCNERSERFGDQDLLEQVLKIKPKLHCFGHAHEGYGIYEREEIVFINAALLNEDYDVTNKPIVLDFNVLTKEVTIC